MLEIRPNCELCDKDLPPSAEDACICSYECTFCRRCVESTLRNVCPNCGGGFAQRPIRPATERRPGVGLEHQPPSGQRVNTRFSAEEIDEFVSGVATIPPRDR